MDCSDGEIEIEIEREREREREKDRERERQRGGTVVRTKLWELAALGSL